MNKGLNDPTRAYTAKTASKEAGRPSARARFAPADNLFDAIRLDVGSAGIENFEPLSRSYSREPPFSEIDGVHSAVR
jgi:hypothetical protein